MKYDIPVLSVVVPVRNAAGTLEVALAAIDGSRMPRSAFEVIVVDDASDDGSASLAARRANTIVRLRGTPSGPAYARNRGAELARAAIILFIDADVRVRPETLPALVDVLTAHPEAGSISAAWV